MTCTGLDDTWENDFAGYKRPNAVINRMMAKQELETRANHRMAVKQELETRAIG